MQEPAWTSSRLADELALPYATSLIRSVYASSAGWVKMLGRRKLECRQAEVHCRVDKFHNPLLTLSTYILSHPYTTPHASDATGEYPSILIVKPVHEDKSGSLNGLDTQFGIRMTQPYVATPSLFGDPSIVSPLLLFR
jgi:hypothetical protein